MMPAIFCLRAMILVQTGHVVDNLISYWELVDKKEPTNFLNNFLFDLRGISEKSRNFSLRGIAKEKAKVKDINIKT